MAKQVIADYAGAGKIIRQWVAQQERQYQVPVLDEQGQPTGEMYDTRQGKEGQPNPNRFRAHLDYLQQKYGGGYQPAEGKPVPEFNPVDPYESSGIGESLTNILARGYTESLTGSVEKLLGDVGVGDTNVDAFGLIDRNKLNAWQPNTAEQIGSGIASFFMPVDLAALAAGGAVGGAVAKGASLGRVGAGVVKTAAQLGSYEGARGFFEGISDPNKSAGVEFAKGFGKGAFLGATLGGAGEVAGRLIPRTIKGSGFINEANRVGAEVFTLGTVSPIIEGQAPTFDDYVNAAGFIVGIKALGALGAMPEKVFNRKRLAETTKIEAAIKEEPITTETAPVQQGRPAQILNTQVERAIDANPGLNSKFVRRLKATEDGQEVGKLGDFIVGENIRKLYDSEALDTPVKVTSKMPEKAAEVGAENVAGWVGWDGDGVYKILISPQHRDAAGFTLLHEAAHLLRKGRGRELGSEQAEGYADQMAKYVAEKKDLTPAQRDKLAQKQWQKPFQSQRDAVVRTDRVTGPAARSALKSIVPDTKAQPEGYVFISEPASKSSQNAKKIFGDNRQGVTIGVYETSPGKKTWTVLDISAPTKEARVDLLKKARGEAQKEGVTLYLSNKMSRTQVFNDAKSSGLITDKPVGKYHQVKETANLEKAPEVFPSVESGPERPGAVSEAAPAPKLLPAPRVRGKAPLPSGEPIALGGQRQRRPSPRRRRVTRGGLSLFAAGRRNWIGLLTGWKTRGVLTLGCLAFTMSGRNYCRRSWGLSLIA